MIVVRRLEPQTKNVDATQCVLTAGGRLREGWRVGGAVSAPSAALAFRPLK